MFCRGALFVCLLPLVFVLSTASASAQDAYSIAVLSDIHIGESSYQTTLAEEAVAKINSMVDSYDIRFVVITGDLSNSALPQEMLAVKAILNNLTVPYLPVLGNHDVWIYNSTRDWEEPEPTGDFLFYSVFRDVFESFPYGELSYFGYQPTFDTFINITSYYQNWELQYEGTTFYGLDWNTRGHAATRLGDLGAMPGCMLHNYTDPKTGALVGTFPWLEKRLAVLPESNNSNIVLFQHQPFTLPPLVPGFVYGFGELQKDQIRTMLSAHHPIDQYWGVIAGHMHIWWNSTAFPRQPEWSSFWQWETCACKRSAAFSIVQLSDGTIVDILKEYGDGQLHSNIKYFCGEKLPEDATPDYFGI